MKKLFGLIFLFFGLLLLFNACVDDYEDANEQPQLDPPDVKASTNDVEILPGRTSQISVNITDAPGGIDSLGIDYDPELGSLVVDQASFDAIKGKDKGSFLATWTSSSTIVDEAEINFQVYDAQSPRRSGSSSVTVETLYEFDAPQYTLTPARAAIAESLFLGGTEVDLSLNMTDVPGGIGDVIVSAEGSQGTIIVDQTTLEGLKGQTSGVLPIKYKTTNAQTGPVTVSFTVLDNSSAKRPSVTATRPFTVDSCSFSGDISGSYRAEATGIVGEADSTYSLSSTVTLTQPYAGVGIISVDDLSFGLYSEIYDRATKPSGTLNLCENSITQRSAVDIFNDAFTISGMLNIDGSITLTWSNEKGDTGEVTLTKQ